jgi:1,4-dihydroxy-2-naphthoyl-CoA hydrolase
MAFRYETTVKLHDTDAAGIVFFGNYLRIAHDAYQTYLETNGISFAQALRERKILIPIVHAEADYIQPSVVGERLTIGMTCSKISSHSFVLKYQVMRDDGTMIATASTVHVMIELADNQKIELPLPLKQALERIYQAAE